MPKRKTHKNNHIPRPPNAFILFRSDFPQELVKTNNGSDLSKISGRTWSEMSENERGVWNQKAADAKKEHQRRFPNYVFKPKPWKKLLPSTKRKLGKKGDELNAAIAAIEELPLPIIRFEAPMNTDNFFRRSASSPSSHSQTNKPAPPAPGQGQTRNIPSRFITPDIPTHICDPVLAPDFITSFLNPSPVASATPEMSGTMLDASYNVGAVHLYHLTAVSLFIFSQPELPESVPRTKGIESTNWVSERPDERVVVPRISACVTWCVVSGSSQNNTDSILTPAKRRRKGVAYLTQIVKIDHSQTLYLGASHISCNYRVVAETMLSKTMNGAKAGKLLRKRKKASLGLNLTHFAPFNTLGLL